MASHIEAQLNELIFCNDSAADEDVEILSSVQVS